jgi:hypothetical protein
VSRPAAFAPHRHTGVAMMVNQDHRGQARADGQDHRRYQHLRVDSSRTSAMRHALPRFTAAGMRLLLSDLQTSPHDVKGSMTIQQVVDAFPQVTAAQICEFLGLPADTSKSTQLKTLAQTGNGREVTELHEWLETKTK